MLYYFLYNSHKFIDAWSRHALALASISEIYYFISYVEYC